MSESIQKNTENNHVGNMHCNCVVWRLRCKGLPEKLHLPSYHPAEYRVQSESNQYHCRNLEMHVWFSLGGSDEAGLRDSARRNELTGQSWDGTVLHTKLSKDKASQSLKQQHGGKVCFSKCWRFDFPANSSSVQLSFVVVAVLEVPRCTKLS